ncbi:hypothetical protein J437_LFUL019206 [Ladona fulva]|uniref:Uncharacterized protein n=1 Tax=Ladona fulva TaxID=123851 RepID=A0A8K0PE95_LADFU|nr:hypothetical protein J437_LFUL019206 [Ladona fulva]
MHPVPLRITPDSQGLPSGNDEEVALSCTVPPRSPRKTSESVVQEHSSGYGSVTAANSNSVISNERTSPKKGCTVAAHDTGDIRPIQRPQPKKYAVPGPGAIPPPPISSSLISNAADFSGLGASNSGPGSLPVTMISGALGSLKSQKKEAPPPPPPRPVRAHTRSSSLDLNHLGLYPPRL